MRRTLKIAFFFCLAFAAWTFSSEKVLSRIATEDGMEEAAPERLEGEAEAEYQVVRLLSKLFALVKRNYLEAVDLAARFDRERDPSVREEIRRELESRFSTLDSKSQEYRRLEPSLRQQYPKLKVVMNSFSKDLGRITRDLTRVRRLARSPAPAGRADFASLPGRRADAAPDDRRSDATAEPAERASTKATDAGRPSRTPRDAVPADPPAREKEPAGREPEAAQVGLPDRPAAKVHERTAERPPERPRDVPRDRGGPAAEDITVPITLEIRSPGGETVTKQKVVFQVVKDGAGSLKGILDDKGKLVAEKAAETDASGKATVRVKLDGGPAPLKIRRTIVPKPDHTICRLQAVAE